MNTDTNRPDPGGIGRVLRHAIEENMDVVEVLYDEDDGDGDVYIRFAADPDCFIRYSLSEEDEVRLRFWQLTGHIEVPSTLSLVPPRPAAP